MNKTFSLVGLVPITLSLACASVVYRSIKFSSYNKLNKLILYTQKVFFQDKSCKLSHHAHEKPVVTAASGAFLMGFYGLWTVFALPGFRKVPICLKVPYLPSSRTQTQNVMKHLHGRAGCLADLGSGDGRLSPGCYDKFTDEVTCLGALSVSDVSDGFLQMTTLSPQYMVFAATTAGFECTGFEINSVLTGYARVKALWRGIPATSASFINQDFWKTNLSKYNNVTVFLAPGVMEVLGRKLEMELPDEARVVACRFPFPDWTPTATEGEGLDQTWAYDMDIIRKLLLQSAT